MHVGIVLQMATNGTYRDATGRYNHLPDDDDDDEDEGDEEEVEEEEEDGEESVLDDSSALNNVQDNNNEKGTKRSPTNSCGASSSKQELSGYVDKLMGEALNLSLERPEEAVHRLKSRLGIDTGLDGKGDEADMRDEDLIGDGLLGQEEPPGLPSAVDEVAAVMEMNPLPPLPSPRDEPFINDFNFMPSSPVDSTRATLDSSSTVTDVSLDMMPGDLRCFEDEGGPDCGVSISSCGYKTPDADGSLFELSSSSESSDFIPVFDNHRPPTLTTFKSLAESMSPPHRHLTKQALTISIPSPVNDMLRVRRSSPSNSPRRRDDGSAYYYVPEATCLIARSLVSKVREKYCTSRPTFLRWMVLCCD